MYCFSFISPYGGNYTQIFRELFSFAHGTIFWDILYNKTLFDAYLVRHQILFARSSDVTQFCFAQNYLSQQNASDVGLSLIHQAFIIIPSNEMKVTDWLIRIQHLEMFNFYCSTNLSKHNIKLYNNQLKCKITEEDNRLTPPNVVSLNASHVAMKPLSCTNVLNA